MTQGINDCRRLDPNDMVARTPIVMHPAAVRVFFLSGILLLVPNGVVFIGLRLTWEPASYAALVTYALTIWKWGPSTKAYWTRHLELSLFEELRMNITRFSSEPGYTTQVGGIKTGVWAREKDEHDAHCKDHRRRYGRSVGDPPVDYQFVIATLQVGGNRQKVAFSDGSAVERHPLKSVIQYDFTISDFSKNEYCTGGEVDDAARALGDLVRITSRYSNGISLSALITSHSLAQDEALLRAIHVGSMWGILCVLEEEDPARLYQLARDSDVPMSSLVSSVTLRLTDAGDVWQNCSDEARSAREQSQRRNRMPRPGSQKIVINSPTGNVNVAGGNFYGQTSNFQSQPSKAEVLEALEAVLQRTDIPWMSADLVGVHAPIERAVQQRDTTHNGLRPAVVKLVQVCENIGLGIVGNTLFEVLKNFVT